MGPFPPPAGGGAARAESLHWSDDDDDGGGGGGESSSSGGAGDGCSATSPARAARRAKGGGGGGRGGKGGGKGGGGGVVAPYEWGNMALLVLLYAMQGIPLGLTMGTMCARRGRRGRRAAARRAGAGRAAARGSARRRPAARTARARRAAAGAVGPQQARAARPCQALPAAGQDELHADGDLRHLVLPLLLQAVLVAHSRLAVQPRLWAPQELDRPDPAPQARRTRARAPARVPCAALPGSRGRRPRAVAAARQRRTPLADRAAARRPPRAQRGAARVLRGLGRGARGRGGRVAADGALLCVCAARGDAGARGLARARARPARPPARAPAPPAPPGGAPRPRQAPRPRARRTPRPPRARARAAQDIAVDGWALTLLPPAHIEYASTCQTLGMNTGYFTSFTVFLAASNPEARACGVVCVVCVVCVRVCQQPPGTRGRAWCA